jgi:uncharacterized membrane protein YoaK (UPF0700 family)
MMLAFAAGAVNGTAFLACQRFVTHVTGTVSRIGLDVGISWMLVLDYLIILVCFVAGAAASVIAIDGRRHRGKRALWAAPLTIVAAILVGVAATGQFGLFGEFGGTVEQPVDFFHLSILAFAMGLQNAAVAATTGLAVRTTHMTGPATDLGLHLGTVYFASGEARQSALRGALLRGGKIVSFALGGAAAFAFARPFGFLAFLLPASAVLTATALSFVESANQSQSQTTGGQS